MTLASGQESPYALATDGTNVYWTNVGGIPSPGMLATGSLLEVSVSGGAVMTLASQQIAPRFVAVDARRAYWASSSEVLSVPLEGGIPTTLVTGLFDAVGVAVDSSNLYWTDARGGVGTVQKMLLDGGAPVTLATGQDNATDAYWSFYTDNFIATVPLAGGATRHFDTDTFNVSLIALDSNNLYYTRQYFEAPVTKLPLDGGPPTALGSNDGTYGVATDGVTVYYSSPEGDLPAGDGALLSIPVAGGTMTTLATGGQPQMVAIDATSVYWLTATTVMKLTPR